MVDISPEYLGVCCIQKGEDMYVSTGCTVFPPMKLASVRENCKIGGVNYGYIKYERAGVNLLVGVQVVFLYY